MPIISVQPRVQAFMVCGAIEDVESPCGSRLALIEPFSGVTCLDFPAEVPLAIYAHLTDAHGRYEVGLQLVDEDGDVVWRTAEDALVEESDPLSPHRVTIPQVVVRFPREGRFDLVMTANGEALAHHALWARRGIPNEP